MTYAVRLPLQSGENIAARKGLILQSLRSQKKNAHVTRVYSPEYQINITQVTKGMANKRDTASTLHIYKALYPHIPSIIFITSVTLQMSYRYYL